MAKQETEDAFGVGRLSMSATRHGVIVTVFVAVVSVALILFFVNVPILPKAASTQAAPIDNMFVFMFAIASVFFAIAMVVLVYSVIAFRARKGDMEDGPGIRGITWLEVVWSVIPLVIVMGLAVQGAGVLNSITSNDPQAMEVKVVAAQWSWQFEYPEQGITTDELVLPVNRPVLLKLNSVDVVHSFWVPEFRVKQDGVPGMETHLRITPTELGTYTVRCAELCGLLHAYMNAPVEVVEQTEFDRWVLEEQSE